MTAPLRDGIWTGSVLPPDRRQPRPSEEEGADGSRGEEGSETKESLHAGVNEHFPQAGLKEGAGLGEKVLSVPRNGCKNRVTLPGWTGWRVGQRGT